MQLQCMGCEGGVHNMCSPCSCLGGCVGSIDACSRLSDSRVCCVAGYCTHCGVAGGAATIALLCKRHAMYHATDQSRQLFTT